MTAPARRTSNSRPSTFGNGGPQPPYSAQISTARFATSISSTNCRSTMNAYADPESRRKKQEKATSSRGPDAIEEPIPTPRLRFSPTTKTSPQPFGNLTVLQTGDRVSARVSGFTRRIPGLTSIVGGGCPHSPVRILRCWFRSAKPTQQAIADQTRSLQQRSSKR